MVTTVDLSRPTQMITPWISQISSSHILVSWDYPDNEGRPPLTGYTIRVRPADWTSDDDTSHSVADPLNRNANVFGLDAGTEYQVWIAAENANGRGP